MNIRDSKVSIIDSDGNIHLMGKAYERKTHITHLLKFLNENYGEIKGLKIGSSRNIYGYVFGKLGYIVYFNDSFSGTGMFYFPDEITQKQIDVLNDLDLGNIKVAICYNPYKVNNDIEYRMIGLDGEHTLKDALGEYLNKKTTIRRR